MKKKERFPRVRDAKYNIRKDFLYKRKHSGGAIMEKLALDVLFYQKFKKNSKLFLKKDLTKREKWGIVYTIRLALEHSKC